MNKSNSGRSVSNAAYRSAFLADYAASGRQLIDNQVLHRIDVWSPEHLDAFRGGARPVDARSDLYSLGVILYELLAGRRPFEIPDAPPDRKFLDLLIAGRLGTIPDRRSESALMAEPTRYPSRVGGLALADASSPPGVTGETVDTTSTGSGWSSRNSRTTTSGSRAMARA